MARIIDVIEVPGQQPDEMVRRMPEYGSGDFRLGSQVIVREFQQAVFFRDGKALDTFGPGRHTITTANVPLLMIVMSARARQRCSCCSPVPPDHYSNFPIFHYPGIFILPFQFP